MHDKYETNRSFADGHDAAIRKIIQDNIGRIMTVQLAGDVKDRRAGADYTVRCHAGGDVAVRVRRNIDHRDLTIRSFANGVRTELEKIISGYGDWYVYAWTDDNNRICDWVLVDLGRLRQAHMLSGRPTIMNPDGETGFIHIPIIELMRADCLAARKDVRDGISVCNYGCHAWADVTERNTKKKRCTKCGTFFGNYATPDSPTFPDEWTHK